MSRRTADDRRLDPGIWPIAAVASLGPLITNLDATVVNVSLTAIGRDLHASIATSQWVVTAYLLALALVLPLSGWLVDRIGAKRVYLACFGLFTAASALCGLAHSITALIASRVVQGIAGGLLAPMAQMMVARHAPRHVARVMSVIVVPVLLGPIFGPSLAGLILHDADWRWIFFINLPIGAAAALAAVAILPPDAATLRPRTLDLVGLALLSPSLVLLLYGLERLAADGPSTADLLAIGAGVAMLAAFTRHAIKRAGDALIDLALFRNRSFCTSSCTLFFANGGSFGGQLLMPLYVLSMLHGSVGRAGLLLAATGLGALCSFPVMGRLTERFGGRRVAVAGALLTLLATVPFAVLSTGLPMWAIVVALFLRGTGLGAISVPAVSGAYRSVPPAEIPAATTALNIVQRVGGPIATAAVAIVLHATTSFTDAFWLLCAILAGTVAATLRLPGASSENVLARRPASAQLTDRCERPGLHR